MNRKKLAFLSFLSLMSISKAGGGEVDKQRVEETQLPEKEGGWKLPACSKKGKATDTYDDEMEEKSNALIPSTKISPERVFLVTTLDGQLTLLDKNGQELWSVYTGEVFSSTIPSMELSENGKWVQMIPSLSGALYKYDDELLVPMPMNVDSLLHKSFKLLNDVVINGGKELKTFGIDLKTGRLRYECGMSGCNHQPPPDDGLELELDQDDEPITLVVKKQLQTVRAVDTRSGMEKWNFSVGTHSIGLTGITEGCIEEEKEGVGRSSSSLLKVVIPEGRLVGIVPESKTVWDKKFPSPIAQAWVLEKGKLFYVDPTQNTPLNDPLAFYGGRHNGQLYVQESKKVANKLERLVGLSHSGLENHQKMPQIAWKPSYLVTSEDQVVEAETALTTVGNVRPKMRPFYVLERDEISEVGDDNVEVLDAASSSNTTPSPSSPSSSPVQQKQSKEGGEEEKEKEEDSGFPKFDFGEEDGPITIMNEVIVASLWYWWKEVLGISLLTAVLLNVILMRPLMRAVRLNTLQGMIRTLRGLIIRDQEEGQIIPRNDELLPILPAYGNATGSSTTTPSENLSRPRTISDSFNHSPFLEIPEQQEFFYISQYLKEFDPVQCLGKGGFGVVFEARKKIDERTYAVKRIALPNREEARVRVMREVKALAQLEHRNIVRYFNSWIENPPNGWLEKNDPLWTNCKIGSMTPTVEHASEFPSECPSESNMSSSTAEGRKGSRASKPSDPRLTSTPLIEEDDSFIVFDSGVGAAGADFSSKYHHDSSSYLKLTEDKGPEETTIDISDSVESSKGFWKKPGADSASWDTATTSLDKSISFISNRYPTRAVMEAERGAAAAPPEDEDVEIAEDAYEIQSSSIMYLYIQQELCQKRTLREWLRNEKERDLRMVVNFFGQIVEAVEYVHSMKLIHRDLKPSNIFFGGNYSGGASSEPVLKIGDFGLATTVLGEVGSNPGAAGTDDKNDNKNNNLTSLVGTQLYMSPEQLRGKPYDYKVDIYSLGIVFFEVLIPFGTDMERIEALSQLRKAKIPSYFKDSYPEEHSLIFKMISHNPNSRPDASAISQWVKSHLRHVDTLMGGDSKCNGLGGDLNTHRSNSSPAHISISRSNSSNTTFGSRSGGDSLGNVSAKNLLTPAAGEQRRIYKSHSFTS